MEPVDVVVQLVTPEGQVLKEVRFVSLDSLRQDACAASGIGLDEVVFVLEDQSGLYRFPLDNASFRSLAPERLCRVQVHSRKSLHASQVLVRPWTDRANDAAEPQEPPVTELEQPEPPVLQLARTLLAETPHPHLDSVPATMDIVYWDRDLYRHYAVLLDGETIVEVTGGAERPQSVAEGLRQMRDATISRRGRTEADDGLRHECAIPAAELIAAYKRLCTVEQAWNLLQQAGPVYHLGEANCEHVARFIGHNEWRCEQINSLRDVTRTAVHVTRTVSDLVQQNPRGMIGAAVLGYLAVRVARSTRSTDSSEPTTKKPRPLDHNEDDDEK